MVGKKGRIMPQSPPMSVDFAIYYKANELANVEVQH